MEHRSLAELGACLGSIRESPTDGGVLRMIVLRPSIGEREIVQEAALDLEVGVVGDNWLAKGSKSTADGRADPHAQVTLTSWRAMNALAGDRPDDAALAGDQLYVDLNLSQDNLPAGTRLAIGHAGAAVQVSAKPHPGCAKFRARFGGTALRFVNTGEGGYLRLRGINAIVVSAGTVRVGDAVTVERPVDPGVPLTRQSTQADAGAGVVAGVER